MSSVTSVFFECVTILVQEINLKQCIILYIPEFLDFNGQLILR